MFSNPFKAHATIFTALAVLALAGGTPVDAGSRIEREFDVSPGGTLEVDTDRGSILVEGGRGSTAFVVITSSVDDIESLMDFEFRLEGDRLEISGDKRGSGGWPRWGRSAKLHYEITIPSRMDVELDTAGGTLEIVGIEGDVALDTSGGSISVEDVRGDVEADTSGGSIEVVDVVGDVTADTSGGSIKIEDVDGEVEADTSGGSIRVQDVTGDLTADTSGGSIVIEDAGGHVRAGTSGGSISATFVAGNTRGATLSVSGGGIEIAVDASAGYDIDASSSGGSITCDLPVQVEGRVSKTRLRGRVGSGGETIKLRSSGGPIRIRKL